MSALTFEILSTELTQALADQSDTPPDTTVRCNLGRDKVMVLVEYPLDSAQAEPTSIQTLDWLERHLRSQFDTAGLPAEAADLADAGQEVPVQLFLKHRSETKPFTMRSFIWKVDDGFDDIFGEPSGVANVEPISTANEVESDRNLTPVFQHPHKASEQVSVSPKSTLQDATALQPPDTQPPDNTEIAAEVATPVVTDLDINAADLDEPVPSELDDENLHLDLESDFESGLDFGEDLSTPAEVQSIEDTEAAFAADLAAGITHHGFKTSSPADFSLPGEAPAIASADLDLPTIDLPISTDSETGSSADFFTELPDPTTLVSDDSFELFGLSSDSSDSTPSIEASLSDTEVPVEESPAAADYTETDYTETDYIETDYTEIPASEVSASENSREQNIGEKIHQPDDIEDYLLQNTPAADDDPSESIFQTQSKEERGLESISLDDDSAVADLPVADLSVDLSDDGSLLADETPADDVLVEEEDPLLAELEASSRDLENDPDLAGPASLDLSPLAYTLSDDDEPSGGTDENASLAYASAYEEDGEEGDSYYLESEEAEYEDPLQDVALIDETEVQQQREQWQQQSKGGTPWLIAGGLGLAVLGVLAFILSRPCSFGGSCDRIQAAQAQGDAAISDLRVDASLQSVQTSQKELQQSIRSLEPIPVWSPHYDEAQAILPEYKNQVVALDLVTKAQEQAYAAAVKSQDPPHPVSTWNEIAAEWLAATQSLEAVPKDSPVRELAEQKLLEYRANRATILVRVDTESRAEVSLRQSQQAAIKATNLAQTAGSLETWEEALAAWESAVDNLSQIPQGTNAHGEAQELLPEYLKQLEEVRDRTEQERSASRDLFKAKQLAADAQKAESEDQWTISAQNWKSALNQLQSIQQGTLAYSEAQALNGLYVSSLSKAENNLETALRFQPIEPEFFAACGATTTQRCTYSVRGGNIRLDLFQGYDSVIDQSITPPDQRVIVPVAESQYVDSSNQLLQSITLLSTQAQVPIELYDAKGDFLARYRPDLNGFVRNQEG